ncbi:hypothetical protein [Silvibacterium acidisoli]|uniref:hypothetical protein n=1 Tax=Acidobacteriaceae bacterium ZG23-2 TaxID=2883246 RepID=UPI00406D1740
MVEEVDILEELQRVLSSSVFSNSPRSSQFLEYCVTCSLRGEQAQLKETTIAVEIFLREATYNPKDDPIVRVHARRVREKLQLYYRTTGRGNPIAIHLPKGSYVAQFQRITVPADLPMLAPEPMRPSPDIIASVEANEEHAFVEVDALGVGQPPPGGKRQHPALVAGLVVALLLAVAATVLLAHKLMSKGSSAQSASLASLRPIDSLPPGALDVAWSPDHKRAAFMQPDNRNRNVIYVLDLRPGQTPQRLTHTAGSEYRPVWSPDGRQIAFIRFQDGTHFTIVRKNLLSGEEAVTPPFLMFLSPEWFHPALDWSPDGKYLLTSDQVTPGTPVRLILFRIRDNARLFLTSPPVSSSGDVDARFSPDGRHVAFHRGGLGDLYVLSLSGENVSDVRQLTFDNRGVQGIAFTPDSRNILFGSDHAANCTYGIYSLPVTGGTPVAVTPEGFAAVGPAMFGPEQLTFRHVEAAEQIVEQSGSSGPASPLFAGDELDQDPSYSPDGESIAFISTRSGAVELWCYHRGAKEPEQITRFGGAGFLFTPHWSPDGERIAFDFRNNGVTNIYVVSLKDRSVKQLTDTNSRNFNPVFGHDGSEIFFSSNADGSPRLWRIASNGQRAAEPLFTPAIASFATSPDGQWLYLLDEAQATGSLGLSRLNLLDGTMHQLLQIQGRPAFAGGLIVTREGIYVALSEPDEPDVEIRRIDPTTWQQRTAWRLPASTGEVPFSTERFDISPDGGRLLTTQRTRYSSTMYMTRIF